MISRIDADARNRYEPEPGTPGNPIRTYLDLNVSITSPLANARQDANLLVKGTVTCEVVEEYNMEDVKTDSLHRVKTVEIQLGNGPFIPAKAQGANGQWSSWQFAAPAPAYGPLTITARVTAGDIGYNVRTIDATDTISITVEDTVKPRLSLDVEPAPLTQPPYKAKISGLAQDQESGLKRLEWQVNQGPLQFQLLSGTSQNWSIEQTLPDLGNYTFTIKAIDNGNNVSDPLVVTVRAEDKTGPKLKVTTPPNEHKVLWSEAGVSLEIAGTATDTQTGVSRVEWRLKGEGTFKPAQTSDNWATWRFPVTLMEPGDRILEIRASDQANNATTLEHTIIVAVAFNPTSPLDVVNPAVYLKDLLEFAAFRLKTSPTGQPVTRQKLEQVFHQPFSNLLNQALREIANRPVHQVRICIEVLRQHLATLSRSLPTTAEQQYRQAAYSALLTSLGTSDDELRLARIADAATRETLAQRLGIALSATRPDRLDQLLLTGSQITEAALQNLFGLPDTTRSLQELVTQPEPQLLLWQQENLRFQWQQQDTLSRQNGPAPLPIIDPDLMGPADIVRETSVAFGIWQTRRQQIDDRLSALQARREAIAAQTNSLQESLDRLLSEVVGPVETLVALYETYFKGEDITSALAPWQLTIKPFRYLMHIRKLAIADSVLEEEWQAVYAILVQVEKLRWYPNWRAEEQAAGLILSPDDFQISKARISLPQWRATSTARQQWQDTLKTRIDQQKALEIAFYEAIAQAETQCLPALRNALIAAIQPDQPFAQAANQLSQKLLIDMQSGSNQLTTRVELAIATIQDTLFSIRAERFAADHPAGKWSLNLVNNYTEAKFEEELKWMGSYATWRAAIFVFGYPENYLLPNLRPQPAQSPAFQRLVQALQSTGNLTPAQARSLVNDYLIDDENPPSPQEVLARELQQVNSRLGGNPINQADLAPIEQLSEAQILQRQQSLKRLFEVGGYTLATIPNVIAEITYSVPLLIALHLQRSSQFLAALDWYQLVYAYDLPVAQRKVYPGLVLEDEIDTTFDRLDWLLKGLNPHTLALGRQNAHTRFVVMSLIQCFLDFADAEFAQDANEPIARARSLYLTALDLLNSSDMARTPVDTPDADPFPPNPMVEELRLHGELNLLKLRNGLNIAGLERQSQFESADNERFSGLATVSGGQIQLTTPTPPPTPYRYRVLIERAQQLVTIAQQIENAFLSTLEKQDVETYTLLKAQQDIALSRAGVDLQNLRISQAAAEVTLAELQQLRSQFQADHFGNLLDMGLSETERSAISYLKKARNLQMAAGALQAAQVVHSTIKAVVSLGLLGDPTEGLAQSFGAFAGAASTESSIQQTVASYERRVQEWQFQQALANQDVRVGRQQVAIAESRVGVTEQEKAIAQIQSDQASETANFLANKFTNQDLYLWMSGILERAYSYFLQQATAMARLAQSQLAFERQEAPPNFVQADYWEVNAQEVAGSDRDRRGMTGSVRLLQDITKLDQYAFETNQRKLQLTQTFSLAELAPIEFQHFRETGVLPFQTPMALFNRDFPGHYLRLIKRVRVSVLALTPPSRGIRASLSSSGLSRVVIGGNVFQPVIVRRDPEMIAFTTTSNATGLFELEPEGEFLLPFEGMGVDTLWQLEMPKAANPIDYQTIGDVLITIEYTALNSFEYRQQVITELDRNFSGDRPFSLRQLFIDQWYELHNPEQSDTPMTIQFQTYRRDFVPNLEHLRIQQVLLHWAVAEGQAPLVVPVTLRFTPDGQSQTLEGTAIPTDGTISTRRGSGSALIPLIGQTPIGKWELELPDTPEVRQHFEAESVEDILLVVTYQGELPAWS